jgi:hypothetical protein
MTDIKVMNVKLVASNGSRASVCCRLQCYFHNTAQQALAHCCSTGHVLPTTYSKNTRTPYVQYVVRDQYERTNTLCVASLTQKGWCPRSVCSGSGDVQLVQQLIQRRSSVGGASFACMSSLACGRPGDSALLLACMFGVLLYFHRSCKCHWHC